MSEETPRTTDFGAPIIAGPFESMQAAKDWIEDADSHGLDIYWEDSLWYVHGPITGGDDAPPLTTYGN